MVIPIILAGGSGTRLWPLSRKFYPKQMLELSDEHTMFQNTLLRLANVKGVSSPVIVCNEEYRFMIAEQLREVNIKPQSIILEPVGRETAPAITVASLKIFEDIQDKDPVVFVLPSDHVIKNISNFHRVLKQGEKHANLGSLVTFGIIPDFGKTEYGYIKKGDAIDNLSEVFKIAEFVEKPDFPKAKEYVDSGNYCWNSGMFMFKASLILNEIKKYAPNTIKSCQNAIEKGVTDFDFFRLHKNSFIKSDSISIDYAVMEKTDKGVMIPFEAGWKDVGSWEALWQSGKKDKNKNVIEGDVFTFDVKNSYLNAQSRLIAAVGIEDHVIVETKDAVLVVSRNRVQDVKKLVNVLKEKQRQEIETHKKVYRPWGSYETLDISDRYQVKKITVRPKAKLSLQKHFHRAEQWSVISGTAIVTKDREKIILKEGESIYIPLSAIHRLENPGKIPLKIIEVQFGSYLKEDDIIRYDDDYSRVEPDLIQP